MFSQYFHFRKQRMEEATMSHIETLYFYLEKELGLEECFRSFFSWSPTLSKIHPILGNPNYGGTYRIICTFSEIRNKKNLFNCLYLGNLTWPSDMSLWLSFWGSDVETYILPKILFSPFWESKECLMHLMAQVKQQEKFTNKRFWKKK